MKMHIALVLVFCLIIPVTANIFDIGNYSIDTGSYHTPTNVAADSNNLAWSWGNNESTNIEIRQMTGDEIKTKITNESSRAYVRSTYGMLLIMADVWDSLGYNGSITESDIEATMKNVKTIDIQKPYPGILAIYPGLDEKIYVTALDDYTYLRIVSTESDEMVAFILRELKVITKENAQSERLKAIQSRL